MRTRWLRLVRFSALALIGLAASPARAAINWTVVIGVDYTDPGQRWAHDGTNVVFALQATGQYPLDKLVRFGGQADVDVTKAPIFDIIAQIGASAQPGDSFFFYYSGHGGGTRQGV